LRTWLPPKAAFKARTVAHLPIVDVPSFGDPGIHFRHLPTQAADTYVRGQMRRGGPQSLGSPARKRLVVTAKFHRVWTERK